jgi:ribosomal protein S16
MESKKMNKEKLIKLRCKAWGITEAEYYCNQCSDFSLEDMARAYRRGKNKGARDKAIQNVGFYQKQMQDIYDKKNKQIQIDAEHIRALQKQNGELTDKVKELEVRCNELFLQTCEQAEKVKELGAQIENIRYYLDNEIPHDLINEATTKIWRMLK